MTEKDLVNAKLEHTVQSHAIMNKNINLIAIMDDENLHAGGKWETMNFLRVA